MGKLWSKRKLRWVAEIINERDPCTEWPNCACQRIVEHTQGVREAGAELKARFSALVCIWTQCWNWRARREAFAELTQPLLRKMLDPNDWPAAKPQMVNLPPGPEPEPEGHYWYRALLRPPEGGGRKSEDE
jgi:hypothetical protein